MELRAEPRFGTSSSAVLEVIRDKVYSYSTSITEVSGIGLRLEVAGEMIIGEKIRLTVDGYQMFAQVRRCVPSESGFTVGVERIDAWNGPPADHAPAPSKTAMTPPVKVLGLPELKNPLDNLHGVALKGLFADPRWRTAQNKSRAILIAAGCIALAGWAGFGAGVSLHRPRRGAAPLTTAAAKSLPAAPESAGQAPASRISIKASDATWVTACADGERVLDTLLNKGYAGEIPFSRQATVRFEDAGAVEVAAGNRSAAKLGPPGQVRTIRATPTSYKVITTSSALSCNLP
jgi:Domain of unknown function (DUF4115)